MSQSEATVQTVVAGGGGGESLCVADKWCCRGMKPARRSTLVSYSYVLNAVPVLRFRGKDATSYALLRSSALLLGYQCRRSLQSCVVFTTQPPYPKYYVRTSIIF